MVGLVTWVVIVLMTVMMVSLVVVMNMVVMVMTPYPSVWSLYHHHLHYKTTVDDCEDNDNVH